MRRTRRENTTEESGTTLVSSLEDLNAKVAWFSDSARPPESGPFVVVVDDFYDDPDRIRKLALGAEYVQYFPPTEEQIGARATSITFRGLQPSWHATALLRYEGRAVRRPMPGFRHSDSGLRDRFAALLGEDPVAETWEHVGDGWNGAFHLINRYWREEDGSVHHHYKEGDVHPRGWSGVVYLSPGAPGWSGTTIWRGKESGQCVAREGVKFCAGRDVPFLYDCVFLVENRYNRLVLFRENVLHRAEPGFGEGLSARMTQTFFFRTECRSEFVR